MPHHAGTMDMSSNRRLEITVVVGLLVMYALLAGSYAIRTAPWQAPDEPAHYNYVAQITANGCCPIIERGDWDQEYLSELTSSRFAPELLDDLGSLQYEDHQPPLYYLLLSPVFSVTQGSLTALRLTSVAFGVIALGLAYLAARVLVGEDRWFIAWGAAALIALIPQHLAVVGSVNNDVLSELIIALALYLLMRYLRGDRIPVWLLGVVVGIGLITKVNTLLLAGVVPMAILFKDYSRRREPEYAHWFTLFIKSMILFGLPILIIAGVWWLRNIAVYGFPDLFGLGAHDGVVADQLRTTEYIADYGTRAYLALFIQLTYNSFWGQFGWMAFPLQDWMYTAIFIFLLVVLAGWGIRFFIKVPGQARLDRWQVIGWLVIGVLGFIAVMQYIYYNAEFFQAQGRYLYPGLLPLGLFVALGLDGWALLWRRRNERMRWIAQLPILLFLPLNLWLIWRVLPLLSP